MGKLFEAGLKTLQLNMVNRISGAGLGVVKSCLFISMLLWGAGKAGIFSTQTLKQSTLAAPVTDTGAFVIAKASLALPFIKTALGEIEDYVTKKPQATSV